MTKRMIGPFEVGDRIGVGGMGIVYRATYTKNGAPVAVSYTHLTLPTIYSV